MALFYPHESLSIIYQSLSITINPLVGWLHHFTLPIYWIPCKKKKHFAGERRQSHWSIDTKSLVRISLYPSKVNLETSHRKPSGHQTWLAGKSLSEMEALVGNSSKDGGFSRQFLVDFMASSNRLSFVESTVKIHKKMAAIWGWFPIDWPWLTID